MFDDAFLLPLRKFAEDLWANRSSQAALDGLIGGYLAMLSFLLPRWGLRASWWLAKRIWWRPSVLAKALLDAMDGPCEADKENRILNFAGRFVIPAALCVSTGSLEADATLSKADRRRICRKASKIISRIEKARQALESAALAQKAADTASEIRQVAANRAMVISAFGRTA